MNWPGLHIPASLRLQVLATSWRLHPPRACRPCSMPDPLLGSTLQSFLPPAQPCAVSSASPLLAFEPPSGFSLRARVRHPVQRFRLKTERVALLGLFPSRVLPLSALARPSPVLPSCGCPLGRNRPNGLHFRVSHAKSTACLFRDRRPSWGFWPYGRHIRSSLA
jgi:hypothetical protein